MFGQHGDKIFVFQIKVSNFDKQAKSSSGSQMFSEQNQNRSLEGQLHKTSSLAEVKQGDVTLVRTESLVSEALSFYSLDGGEHG